MPITPINFSETTSPDTGVDYAAFTSEISKGIDAGITAYQQKKTDVAEAQGEIQQVYDENSLLASQNGDYLNERVVKFGEEGSMKMQKISNAYERGQISRDVWLRTKNNINNGAKQINDFVTLYDTSSKAFNERLEFGSLNKDTGLTKAGALDVFNNERLNVLAQLKGHGFFLGTEGQAFFGKYGKDGKISGNAGDFLTIPAALNGASQEYNNFDMAKNADAVAKRLAPVIRSKVLMSGGVKTLEDVFQDKDSWAAKQVEFEWNTIAGIPEALISIITAQGPPPPPGSTEWGITLDPQEAEDDAGKILVKASEDTNRWTPVTEGKGSDNYNKAIPLAKKAYETAIRSRMGIKETASAVATRKSPTGPEIDERNRLKTLNEDLVNLFAIQGVGGIATSDIESAGKLIKNRAIKSQGKNLPGFTTKQFTIDETTGNIVFDSDYDYVGELGEKTSDAAQETVNMKDGTGIRRNPIDVVKEAISVMYGQTPTQKQIQDALATYSNRYKLGKTDFNRKDGGYNPMYAQDKWKTGYEFNYKTEKSQRADEWEDIAPIKVSGYKLDPTILTFEVTEGKKSELEGGLKEHNKDVVKGLNGRSFGGYKIEGDSLVFTANGKKYIFNDLAEFKTEDGYSVDRGLLANVYNKLATGNNPATLDFIDEVGVKIEDPTIKKPRGTINASDRLKNKE